MNLQLNEGKDPVIIAYIRETNWGRVPHGKLRCAQPGIDSGDGMAGDELLERTDTRRISGTLQSRAPWLNTFTLIVYTPCQF